MQKQKHRICQNKAEKGKQIQEADVAGPQTAAVPPKTGYWAVKRLLDILLSVFGLLLLLIPMAMIALIVFIDDPGSVIFSQYRVGRFGKLFRLYKFRTMRPDAPHSLATAAAQTRHITRVGAFLRKTSLDELPQLVNVLQGSMSLVGPRPLIPEEQEIHRMRKRLGVYHIRPGITGLAQINGRDTVSPGDKVRMDVQYAQTFGFWTDAKILFGTFPKLLGQDVVEGSTRDAGMIHAEEKQMVKESFHEACDDDRKRYHICL